LNVSGNSADKVQQLLASDSDWLSKFQQLASSIQAKSAQFSSDRLAPPVTIEIDQDDAKVY
jgi:hypothetical protein